MQFPIEKNQRIQVHIDAYNADGAGVARFKNVAVFIPGTVTGETVYAQVIKITHRYAIAKLLDIISASPLRVDPPCPVYNRCGGCVLQHMHRDEQQRFKQQRIYDCFLRIGHIDLMTLPVVHCMRDAYRYRNKASFPVSLDRGGPHIGLYAPRSHNIVDVDDCLLQYPDHSTIIRIIRAWVEDYSILPYEEHTHRGTLRHIVTRRSKNGSWLICLVAAKPPEHADVLIGRLTQAVSGITGIVLNINKRTDNVILSSNERLLFGQPRLMEPLMRFDFSVSAQSFMQVNAQQVEVLYGLALDFADLNADETVVDAYCGIGTMTLLFAQHARFVHGIDCVPAAIEDAKYNARLNGIGNVGFQCGYAQNALEPLFTLGETIDVLLLDPPRKGCDMAVLECAIAHRISRIVYISCNPATLARDVSALKDGGYTIKRVEGVDMFGQTSHVECVVLITRVEKQG